MRKSALERRKKKFHVCCFKSTERGHDYVGIAKAGRVWLEAGLEAILESREREPFASASNASSESARTVVSGPQTIATRIAELSSVTFGSRTGVISADIEEMLLQSSSARNREPSLREFFQKATPIDCAGFQLDLEIALSGGSSEGPAPSGFSARPKMR